MTSDANIDQHARTARLLAWARRHGLARKLALALAIAAVVSGIATYGAMTRSSSPFGPDPTTVVILVLIDLLLVLSLGALVSSRLVRLWIARRQGSTGSRLHTRLVGLFSIVAVAPAILVGIFSVLFFDFGIQAWFSERVRIAVDASTQVAEAYTEEHHNVIRADIRAMAAGLNRAAPQLSGNIKRLNSVVNYEASLRGLGEAIVIDGSGRVFAQASTGFEIALEPIPSRALDRAASGEIVIITHRNADRVRALVRLDAYSNYFLYIGRYVDPRVIGHVNRTRDAVAEYRRLDAAKFGIRITQAAIFLVVTLLVLLAAIWFALSFASRLVGPVSSLVNAAEKVRDGDLTVRVPEGPTGDEIGMLSRAFNRMTDQLEGQRGELMQANEQLDARRRFTEAVLSGVSAGVIGLDAEGVIDLPSRSAVALLETSAEDLVGQPLQTAVPEMTDLLNEARSRPSRRADGQITVVRKGRRHILLVRIAAERTGQEMQGFVVTFDDITELVAAQRTSAWADIARRIAHEIKNPLTPIQLSAERLKRKYLSEITTDPDVFVQCTDTIIRQVGDIGRMVDEFSAFARMPSPTFEAENLQDLGQQAVFMQQVAHAEIKYSSDFSSAPVIVRCDRRQVAQALTNLMQNAADALTESKVKEGAINVRIFEDDGQAVIEVTDNGPGLPAADRHRLTEPYVTNRTKGTGLGLAIVRKVMEDHGGQLMLDDSPDGGAQVRLVFDGSAGIDDEADNNQEHNELSETEKAASHG